MTPKKIISGEELKAKLLARREKALANGNDKRQAMTHPEYTVQGLLQAKADYLAQRDRWEPDSDLAALEWIDKRARELTAATPAPDAAGDAVRALVAKWLERSGIRSYADPARSAYKTCADELEAALANPPPSAGAGGGVEGESK